jgi:hypothetical protein
MKTNKNPDIGMVEEVTTVLGGLAKYWVATGGAAITALVALYPHPKWLPIVTGAITSVLVYVVPNAAKSSPPPTPSPKVQPLPPEESSQ